MLTHTCTKKLRNTVVLALDFLERVAYNAAILLTSIRMGANLFQETDIDYFTYTLLASLAINTHWA